MSFFSSKNDECVKVQLVKDTTAKLAETKIKEERGFIIERQIHGQFSDNSNAHVSSFVTFVVSLLALFGAFGYVYANTVNVFRIGFGFWPELPFETAETLGQHKFTVDSFLWLAITASIMLCFIACLCIFLGYAERRDQLQQHIIRDNYGVKTVYSKPSDNNNWCYFLSDFYRMFYYLLIILQVLVIIVSVFRIVPFMKLTCINPNAGMLMAFTLIVQVVCVVVCLATKRYYFKWYQKKVTNCDSDSKK